MLKRVIDEHTKTYDNFIFIGDFYVGIGDENSMKNFCEWHKLLAYIKV